MKKINMKIALSACCIALMTACGTIQDIDADATSEDDKATQIEDDSSTGSGSEDDLVMPAPIECLEDADCAEGFVCEILEVVQICDPTFEETGECNMPAPIGICLEQNELDEDEDDCDGDEELPMPEPTDECFSDEDCGEDGSCIMLAIANETVGICNYFDDEDQSDDTNPDLDECFSDDDCAEDEVCLGLIQCLGLDCEEPSDVGLCEPIYAL